MKIIILVVMVLSFNVNAEQKYNDESYPVDEEGYVIMDSSANDAYMDNDPGYKPEKWVPGAEYEPIAPPPNRARELRDQKNAIEKEKARHPVQKPFPKYGVDSSDGSIIYFH